MYLADQWKEYELIDTDDGRRLERWKDYLLIRPDPQVIWKGAALSPLWKKADASYLRSHKGGGQWDLESRLPEQWTLSYESLGLTFKIKPMGFKHTGLFPEQAVNWEWFTKLIRNAGRPIRVLNLFAYTGGATVAAAKAGASVTHVDAAKGMVAQARENAALSGLADAPIRWIVDDCRKFVEREIRRGNRYDAIILDPPSYGRGPTGEIWKLEESIHPFLELCVGVLSDDPLFVLLNTYTTGLSPSAMGYLLGLTLKKYGGKVECDEVGLPVTATSLTLPCGAAARWSKE
ncbi:MAG: class I SAM-dependent methyltransferase [Eubacteriales bacterium]